MRRNPSPPFHFRLISSRPAALRRWLLVGWLLLLAVITPATPTPVAQAADPDTISGLHLWLDASDPDADANSGNNPADGAALTIWHDKSGGNRDAIVAPTKNSGTYRASGGTDFNNTPVVEFARSSQFLGSIYQVAGLDIRAATMEDVTIFTVYKVGADVQPQTALWGADNGNWDRFFYPRHTAFGDTVDDGVAGLGPVQAGAVVADSGQVGIVRLLTAVYDGEVSGGMNNGPTNGSTIYFDGQIVTRFTDSTHPTDAQSSFYVGWDGDDNPFVGEIAEILVYDRALNAGEISSINEYLNTKYGQNFATAAPGGVSDPVTTDPKVWLRADAGVTGTSNVTGWADQGPANLTASAVDGPSLTANTINGNPALSFNGTSEEIAIPGGIFGTSSFDDASVYVIARTNAAQNGTVFAEQVSPTVFSASLPGSGADAQWYAGDNTGAHALEANWGGQTGQPYLWSLLSSTTGTAVGNNQVILRNGASLGTDATASSFTGAAQDFTIGSTFEGDIAEIVVYTSKLTSQEHDRVQSYLAIKYGLTLEGQNYVDSDDTVIWNAKTNAGYNSNIAGIGADDASALAQLSSRSMDSGVLSVTGNSAAIANKEFLIWGDNNAALSASADVPSAYEQRLQRVWRIQQTGDTGTLTSVSFDLSGIPGINLALTSDFALLTDPDGVFANGTATTGATRLGNVITFSNVDSSGLDGLYVSLAYPDVDVSITAPADGATTGNRPSFSGMAEVGSTVEVREGGTLLCSAVADGSGNWTCTPSSDLTDGSHTVDVTATLSGFTSLPVNRTFTSDGTAPSAPVVSAPAAGAFVGLRPGFSGTAEVGSTVEVREGGTLLCSAVADGSGNWTCTPSSDLTDGSHTVDVTATDAYGNESTATTRAFIVDTNAPAAPVVSNPSAGALLTVARPTFSGTAEAGSTVEVLNGATVLCTTTADGSGNWSCTATSDMADGDHTVSVTAIDQAGVSSSATTRSFSIDTGAPDAPAVSTPAAGAALATKRPVFSGTAEVGSTVEVREGSTLICQATAQVDGSWNCIPAVDLADGAYTVSVTATDAGGQTSAATTRSFSIDTGAPDAPTVDTDGSQPVSAKPTFSGTGEPGTTIEIRDGETLLCTALVQLDSSWGCTSIVQLGQGDHDLTIVARDSAGNVSQISSFTITVQVETKLFMPLIG